MSAGPVGPVGPVSLLDGLATTRSDPPVHRRSDPRRRPRGDPVARRPGASGSNRQPFRYVVLRDGPTGDRRPSRCSARRSERDGQAERGRTDGYPTPSRFADSMQQYVDRFEQVPVVVLVCLERYRAPSPYEGASVYPACQNLLLAARALGYGGATDDVALGVEAELRALLDVPGRRRAVRVHHARAAGRATTGRCNAGRSPRSSSTTPGGSPRRGSSVTPCPSSPASTRPPNRPRSRSVIWSRVTSSHQRRRRTPR